MAATRILGVIITSLGNAPFNIAFMTLIQRYAEPKYLGRVRGTIDSLGTLSFLTASGLAGLTVSLTAPRTLLAGSAGILVVTAVLVTGIVVPKLKNLAASNP